MNQHEQIAKSRLGRLLVNRGYITEDQLSAALVIQAKEGVMLGEVLVGQGLISEKDLQRTLKHQKRYRYTAAFVAMVAAPLQPMIAMAASPTALPINNTRVELSEVKMNNSLGGMKMMDDAELAGVSAQGLAPGLAIGLGQNGDGIAAGFQHKYHDPEDDEENREEQIAYELADSALTLAGLGPISNLIDAKISIEGVKYQDGQSAIEILEGGKMRFYMPTEIARVSMEDMRVKGNTSGPTLGSIYLSDIKFAPGSNYTITPRN